VYSAALGSARPARTTVAVSGLPRNVLVEIDAVAKVGPSPLTPNP
jgi:enamine deaminase RidA (YjgF/YER057c/UK114 family)